MARNYTIDFTDPLTGSFNIPDAGFNGPGGKESNTSLRLYGRGAPEWGESVDENFAKMLETFMGATAPHYPVPGQLWIKTYLYFMNTSVGQWYVWDIDNGEWNSLDVVWSDTEPDPTQYPYWYNSSTGVLSQYFRLYKQELSQWHERAFRSGPANPVGLYGPEHLAQMFDVAAKDWVDLPVVEQSNSEDGPPSGRAGTLRFDPDTGNLKYWDTTHLNWAVISTVQAAANPAIVGDLEMNNFHINHLASPVAAHQALNLGFSDARYLVKQAPGDTMAGPLTLGAGAPTQPLHAATKAYVDTTAANVAAAAVASIVSIPPGVILMWSGQIATIPAGWRLCDGTFGTPDLRDRFVMGAGLTYGPGGVGGSADSSLPAHAHTVFGTTDVAGAHVHDVVDPGHVHSTVIPFSNENGGSNPWGSGGGQFEGNWVLTLNGAATGVSIGTAGSHQHNINASVSVEGGGATNTNLPPFFTLAFIMKV